MRNPINVTTPYIPKLDRYIKYIEKAFENKFLTNNGPLVQELTEKLKDRLNVKNLLLVSNGTIALQVAYKIKQLANKNVLTTPYTFAATATALDWEQSNIVFTDIDHSSWNLDSSNLETTIVKRSIDAIVPVNLFGTPCNLEEIDKIALKHGLPVIYDSAHALFSTYKNESVLNFGDIHCVSLHATKLFHCVEGGLMTFKDEKDYLAAKQLINFGISENNDINIAGINGKMSEVHAAMGLCILDDLPNIIEYRQTLIDLYKKELNDFVDFQQASYQNFCQPIYMPVKFDSEENVLKVLQRLNSEKVYPRRYFLPNHYNFLKDKQKNEITDNSLDIAQKVLCLPLSNDLSKNDVLDISNIIKSSLT